MIVFDVKIAGKTCLPYSVSYCKSGDVCSGIEGASIDKMP
jgi:hypothetical protein